MAATGSTQTTTTAASAASPAAGAGTSTAEQSSTAGNQQSESGSAFASAFAADLEAAAEETGTDKDQANRGTNAARTDKEEVNGQEVNGQEAQAKAGEETTGEEETEAGHKDEEENEDGSEGKELPEEVDPEKPPKGMENVPKSVWKRLQTQGKELKELKAQAAQGAVILKSSAAHPLSEVKDLKTLEARLGKAKALRRSLEEHPEYLTDGAKIRQVDGSVLELSPAQVKERKANADAVFEAAPDHRVFLAEREQNKPWETAAQIVPDIFKPGSHDNSFMKGVLKETPEFLKTKDWEVMLACMARGYREFTEEQSGAAEYVRNVLDKGGKVIPPKAKATGTNGKPKPQTPGGTRPPVRQGQSRASADEALAALPATATQEQRARAALEAELAAV